MPFIRKILNNNTGSAGLLALLAMVFFGIIGGAYVTLSNSGVQTAANLRDGVAAQYLAEAGAQWAIAKIKADPSYGKEGTPSVIVDKNPNTATAGEYKVTVNDKTDPSTKTITSTGTVNKSTRTVVLQITAGELGVLGNTLYSRGNMSINASASSGQIINGSIESPGIITVSGEAINTKTINGNVFCPNFNDNDHKIKAEGEVKSPTGKELIIDNLMPTMPKFEDFKKSATDLKTIPNGIDSSYYCEGPYPYRMPNYSYTVPKTIIYVNGDFEIGNDIIGEDITIYVNGKITFTNKSSIIEKPSIYKIYATGDVELNQTVAIGKGIIVTKGNIRLTGAASAPQTIFIAGGNIEVNNNSKVGALYANGKLDLNGGSIVDYDKVKDFVTKLIPPTVTSWSDK